MAFLPHDIFEKLVCSLCQKYLSVPPIKEHNTGRVTCGRCCNDQDKGVKSNVYEMIAKNLKFPCIYYMEGCTERLNILKMKTHEQNCHSNIHNYQCPLCLYKGDSYSMPKHIEEYHKSELIENKSFIISSKHSNPRGIFFYFDKNILLYIEVKCDNLTVSVDLRMAGQNSDLTYIMSFYSSNRKLTETGKRECNAWNSKFGQISQITQTTFESLKDKIECIFEIQEISDKANCFFESDVRLVFNPNTKECIVEYVSSMEDNKLYYSTPTNILDDNLPISVCIKKNIIEGQAYLGIGFAMCITSTASLKKTYSIDVSYTLDNFKDKKSNIHNTNHYTISCNKKTNENMGEVPNFIKFDDLLNSHKGFTEDDSIKLRISIVDTKKCKEENGPSTKKVKK